jgi:hypothetical protein
MDLSLVEFLFVLAAANGSFFLGYYSGRGRGVEEGRRQGALEERARMGKEQFFEKVEQDAGKGGLFKN